MAFRAPRQFILETCAESASRWALDGSALRVDGRCVVTREGGEQSPFHLAVGDCADSHWELKSLAS